MSSRSGDELVEMLLAGEEGRAANDLLLEVLRRYPAPNLSRLIHSDDDKAVASGAFVVSELRERAAPILDEVDFLLATQLAAVGNDAAQLPDILGRLRDPDKTTRMFAAAATARVAPTDRRGIEQAAISSDPEIRRFAESVISMLDLDQRIRIRREQERRDRDRLTGLRAATAMLRVRGSRLMGRRPGRQPPENLLQEVAVAVQPGLQPLQPFALAVQPLQHVPALVQHVAGTVQPSLQPLQRDPMDAALLPEVSRVLVDETDRIAQRIDLGYGVLRLSHGRISSLCLPPGSHRLPTLFGQCSYRSPPVARTRVLTFVIASW